MIKIFKKYHSHISLLLLAYNIFKNNYNAVFTFKYLNFEFSIKFL